MLYLLMSLQCSACVLDKWSRLYDILEAISEHSASVPDWCLCGEIFWEFFYLDRLTFDSFKVYICDARCDRFDTTVLGSE